MIVDKIFSVEKYWCFSYFSTKTYVVVLIRIIVPKSNSIDTKDVFVEKWEK